MRISDWSSDVCSSDLTHLLGQSDCLTPAPFQRDIERSARPGQRRLPLQRAVDAQIGGIASLLDLRDQQRSRQTRLPESRLPVALDHREIGRAAVEIPCQRHRRSEEQTSELQSLMRISYAVFCLKKKIQNTRYEEY